MKQYMLFTGVLVLAIALGACTAQIVDRTPDSDQSFANYDHECTQDQLQAEVCTMEYMPVCGNDGVTYGNGCSACSTQGVYAYSYGECEVQGNEELPFEEDACGASTLQNYVGSSIEEMDVASYSDSYRVIRPGDAVTLDHRVERLNVHLDEADIVEMIVCG